MSSIIGAHHRCLCCWAFLVDSDFQPRKAYVFALRDDERDDLPVIFIRVALETVLERFLAGVDVTLTVVEDSDGHLDGCTLWHTGRFLSDS